MVLLASWLLLNEEIWEICFLKAALWRHQAHQDMAPPPLVVSAEQISVIQGHIKKKSPKHTKNHERKTWLFTSVFEKMTSEAYCPGLPTHRSTTHSDVLSWLARKLSAYLIVCAWTCSGAFPDWSVRHLLPLWFRVWMLLCLRPLRTFQAQAKCIGFCREPKHCDFYIETYNDRMVWVGRHLRDRPVPTPLPWAGTPSTRPGFSKTKPTWPWALLGRGHPQLLWETFSSASPPS